MSQIPRSQFALKKRQNASPMMTIPVLDIEHQNVNKSKKSHSNGSSNGNGHKNGTFDNDVVIIEDEFIVGQEEVVAEVPEQLTPTKKKRSRKSKDSTESKDSTMKSTTLTEEKQVAEKEEPEKETKVVKMTEDLLASKRRSDRLQNASTIVNLSSVSSTEGGSVVNEDTPTATERRVSGRRSTRPIDEIKFTYRTTNPDDSLDATTNATIGSELNDSLLTSPGFDRKRRPINESMENLESPKRSRLDLSGLFSSFSSPVAMLRNRFKRTNIASTPVAGGVEVLLNESVESLDTTTGEEMKEIDLNAKEVSEVADKNEEEEEIIVKVTPAKKSSCSIM